MASCFEQHDFLVFALNHLSFLKYPEFTLLVTMSETILKQELQYILGVLHGPRELFKRFRYLEVLKTRGTAGIFQKEKSR